MRVRLDAIMPFVTTTVFACLAASAAGIATVFVAAPVVRFDAEWVSEALVGCVAGFAWMTIGLRVAGLHAATAASLIFVAGAATAWFLSRGIVHSTTPYYGLFTVGSACCGGWTAWLVNARRGWSRPAHVMAAILPPVVVLFGLSVALLNASFGTTRLVMAGDSVVAQVSVVLAGFDENDTGWLVWSADDLMIGADSMLRIQMDPGSGAGRYRLTSVNDARQIGLACSRFRSHGAELIESEISQGMIPAFITKLPVRYEVCERGAIWVARP